MNAAGAEGVNGAAVAGGVAGGASIAEGVHVGCAAVASGTP
ncbi:MAG: hypothetical protein RLZZ21_2392, partial [Planctomycetota bacterium]